jgi:flavodoxin
MKATTMVSRRQALGSSLLLPMLAGVGTALAEDGKGNGVLVAYFTRTGNTQLLASIIARSTGADLFRIVPAQPYPEDYEAQVAQAESERERGFEPPLQERVANIARYQTVFLGFPVWGTTAPSLIRSFLSQHDVSGKTLVPFITHGGYGPGSSEEVVAAHAQNARIVAAFVKQCDQERQTIAEVTQWLGGVAVPR